MAASLIAFALAAIVLILLPGPDTMIMLRAIAVSGRTGGLRTAAGIVTGLGIWIASASIGLAALLRASEVGFTVLRIAGAAYLLTLGIQALRGRGAPDRRGLLGTGYAAGLACNLFNPKVGVFFVTFLPGFTPAGQSVGVGSLVFGAIFLVETAVYFALLLLLAQRVVGWLGNPRVRQRLDRMTGTVLIAFAIRLAVEA
jgi:threonine/homoserine/homoserine lactone efflux protein